MRSPLAGWLRLPIALLVAVAGALVAVPAVALPAVVSSASATAATVSTLSPADGELVAGDPLLRWTPSDGAGYEVRWNAAGDLDDAGVLDTEVDGGRAFPGGETHQLSGLTAATYHWQVRALPDGAWSNIATFHLDIQLDTLGPGPVGDTPTVETPVDAHTPEAGAGINLSTAVNGFVWIAAASTFAGLLLAVVGREWLRLRLRRQES